MTGRQKLQAAFSGDGTPEIGVVIPYEDIYIRDHWSQLTLAPWWHVHVPDVETQARWRKEVIAATGQDWFQLPGFWSREERRAFAIEERADGVYRMDGATKQETKLLPPPIGGWISRCDPGRLADSFDEIDRLVPEPPTRAEFHDGRGDLASALLREFGGSLFPIRSVDSPLWACWTLWGFEGMMTMAADRPDLVSHACERYLAQGVHAVGEAAALGAAGIWIEECMTDMVSPSTYEQMCLPYVRRLVDVVRAAGLVSIHYYCGSPWDRMDALLSTGADAISLEEGKKGFEIDIRNVVERVGGRCAVLGNLDAVGVLQDGTEDDLRREIARQIGAGRANRSRFVMSLGSPVTPGTPVRRVRLYCDMAREIGLTG